MVKAKRTEATAPQLLAADYNPNVKLEASISKKKRKTFDFDSDLTSVLVREGGELTSERLFSAANYSESDVESFFLSLRNAIKDQLIVEERLPSGHSILKRR